MVDDSPMMGADIKRLKTHTAREPPLKKTRYIAHLKLSEIERELAQGTLYKVRDSSLSFLCNK